MSVLLVYNLNLTAEYSVISCCLVCCRCKPVIFTLHYCFSKEFQLCYEVGSGPDVAMALTHRVT